jgi:hypothetical protein
MEVKGNKVLLILPLMKGNDGIALKSQVTRDPESLNPKKRKEEKKSLVISRKDGLTKVEVWNLLLRQGGMRRR